MSFTNNKVSVLRPSWIIRCIPTISVFFTLFQSFKIAGKFHDGNIIIAIFVFTVFLAVLIYKKTATVFCQKLTLNYTGLVLQTGHQKRHCTWQEIIVVRRNGPFDGKWGWGTSIELNDQSSLKISQNIPQDKIVPALKYYYEFTTGNTLNVIGKKPTGVRYPKQIILFFVISLLSVVFITFIVLR